MTYHIKEIFYTLQGEGSHTGRPAVFCRFSACNLWSGNEKDRARAVCQFCDTDFVGTNGTGGGKYTSAFDLASAVTTHWPTNVVGDRMVVCTGGEPLLQLDDSAISALHSEGFYVAVETNGTILPPSNIDWLCVSPKIGSHMVVRSGDELKFVYPQVGGDPEQFVDLDFSIFRIQPLDSLEIDTHIVDSVRYCLEHPRWRLSLQTHKMLGIR